MAKVQLDHQHVVLGQPLKFDLVDERGIVWLKNGYVIKSKSQLDQLIDRGVYFDEIIDESRLIQQAKENKSIFSRVSELAEKYNHLFESEVVNYREILSIAELIQELCELDGDAALANIQLNRSGRYSLRHSFHSALMAELLLRRLERPLEERRYAIAGALTMNICMLELQDLLYQQNSPLTPDQKRAVVTHPLVAVNALREQGVDHPVWIEVVEHHHEMIDESGYPRRLSKSELSIESQVVSFADRYCAMVSERQYRPGILPSLVAQNLLTRQASTIDSTLADAFLKEVGSRPPGTFVALASGEVAVVVRRLLNVEQPLARSLRSPSGIRFADPPKRNTGSPVYAIKETLGADVIKDFDWPTLWPLLKIDEINGVGERVEP